MSGGEPAHRQRIRIGLTGLGVVFLLVMIVIMSVIALLGRI